MPRSDTSGDLFVGLMSGTSMDGVDAALVRFGAHKCELVASHQHAYPAALRSRLVACKGAPQKLRIDDFGELDSRVGSVFADAANALLAHAGVARQAITAIGSHGQTLRHRPQADPPFTLQIGDPNIIAVQTGITTVADFRRRDMAVGGGGAPLAPAFHQWLFGDDHGDTVILNLGGIANITILANVADHTVGFDTGPANGLRPWAALPIPPDWPTVSAAGS
jgi:anhydro-N-acetylmuramic acid kinase